MKITSKILSIPPYLSARWSQVHSLYMRESNLVICLADGNIVSIPNLTPHEIEAIFAAHSSFSETQQEQSKPFTPMQALPGMPGQNIENVAMHFNLENMEAFGSTFHHNPDHAHIPNFPPEILSKIAAIAKIVAPGELHNIPKPEPQCNCPHCQIARAIHGKNDTENKESYLEGSPGKEEEIVHDKDLAFQQWEISQIGDKLYSVVNRLDHDEKYNVFLGEPVGCTCGISGCEHILAVLRA